MAAITPQQNISALRKAFQQGELTLFLGAGVSIANGLPPWDKLVLAMYFSAISQQSLGGWRPFPNYLFAIAEWHLNRAHEPLDITARKIRKYLDSQEDFLRSLRNTLYAGYAEGNGFQPLDRQALRSANSTLDAVAKLCERSSVGSRGVRSVVSYNYDELLEAALGDYPFQSFWKAQPAETGKLPIYHVHGYVPMNSDKGSAPEEVVFTETQYHLAAQDTYSWSNLVQMQGMSASTGLMIGLSLSDRNIRRLLDAIAKLPSRPTHYALLQKPKWPQPVDAELQEIDSRARSYFEKFTKSGVKSLPGVKADAWKEQILGILNEVERLDVSQQTFVLNELGISPIWYDDHAEIQTTINQIVSD